MTLCCWRHWTEQGYVRLWPKAAVGKLLEFT